MVLLSTMHSDHSICEDDDKEPDIVLFHNSTKGGVDSLGQSYAKYATKRKTLRWPPYLFFTFLDIAAVNTTVIWSELNPPTASQSSARRLDRRRQLLIELGESLTVSWTRERATVQHVVCHPKVREAMTRVGIIEEETNFARPAMDRRRGRCFLCQRKNEQTVQNCCKECGKFVCSSLSKNIYICTVTYLSHTVSDVLRFYC